ncbi:hypothetical protein HPB51_011689 [Rhipicephalus microplus]|uniref:Uncharacterized protein n=1 Tax=Rhipicephalus microplus TaxID=6941 RepID=A0A9J6DML5_RHIMP|nr:hypothetical protein HPB51_011689 [Rhipicephalus microplus]
MSLSEFGVQPQSVGGQPGSELGNPGADHQKSPYNKRVARAHLAERPDRLLAAWFRMVPNFEELEGMATLSIQREAGRLDWRLEHLLGGELDRLRWPELPEDVLQAEEDLEDELRYFYGVYVVEITPDALFSRHRRDRRRPGDVCVASYIGNATSLLPLANGRDRPRTGGYGTLQDGRPSRRDSGHVEDDGAPLAISATGCGCLSASGLLLAARD